jgi:hypothetical protein
VRVTTATPSPSDLPGGSPFEDQSVRQLWEAGYAIDEQDFETEAQALEAAAAVLALHPGLCFQVHP